MKVTEETISPKRAEELLAKHWNKDHQRKPSNSVVDQYARAMSAGQWMLTHQGIAIDTAGELADGVHRLLAVVQSGTPVRMLITRGIPHNGNGNGSSANGGMYAIDAIDRGRVRNVGQQLQLRHGITNATVTAAACRTILLLMARSIGRHQIGAVTVGDALRVRDHFGSEIDFCVENQSRLPGLRSGVVAGAFAFAMRPFPQPIKDAYVQCMSGENITRGNPMYTLRNYLLQKPSNTSGSTAVEWGCAVLHAAQKHVVGEEMRRLVFSEAGFEYFLEKQRPTVQKLLAGCGFMAGRKGTSKES